MGKGRSGFHVGDLRVYRVLIFSNKWIDLDELVLGRKCICKWFYAFRPKRVNIFIIDFPHVNPAPRCSSKTAEGKLSYSSPPPSFPFQLLSSLFTRRPGCYVLVPFTRSCCFWLDTFKVFLTASLWQRDLSPWHWAAGIVQFVEEHHHFLALNWASSLICIVKLLHSTDLPLFMSDSVPPTSSFIPSTSFLSSIISSPGTQVHPSLTLWS